MEEWEDLAVFKKGKYAAFKNIKAFTNDIQVISISDGKKKDLLSMLDYLGTQYLEFYKEMCSS